MRTIDVETVHRALELEGVDVAGLDDLDRRYLKTLIDRHAVDDGSPGVQSIAATMREDVSTIEDVIEPFLLHQGFIIRTASGRRATPKAYLHLGLRPPRPKRAGQRPLPFDEPPADEDLPNAADQPDGVKDEPPAAKDPSEATDTSADDSDSSSDAK